MKKTIKLALVAALALGATSAFATNGSNLIGIGAKARGMGGVSIGMAHGAESGISNGALITSVKDTEVSFAGTLFMPNVNYATQGASNADSAADMSVIPAVSIASKINDNFYWGIGMWGTAGMGVDYRASSATSAGTMNMVTNLQLMQFGVPLAYTTNGFSVAVTPILQYGSLDMNYDQNPGARQTGAGVAQDLKFGYNIGLAYEISGFTVGAVYKSQIDMEYTGVLSVVTQPFAAAGVSGITDKLSTPAELGLGVSYVFGANTVALDYKQIKWADAEGYKQFGWEDQTVIAIGYEYTAKTWAARVGYNHGDNPIAEQSVTSPTGGAAYNMLNLLGFPGTVESHYTIGGTYNINEKTSIDLAYVYAPETETTFKTSNGGAPFDITAKHSQTSVSFGLNYTF